MSSFLLALGCLAAAPWAGEGAREQPAHEVTLSQLDALAVTLEAAPTELHVGDVLFVRLTATYQGDRPLVAAKQHRLRGDALELKDFDGWRCFDLLQGFPQPFIDRLRLLPGQQLTDRRPFAKQVPNLERVGHPFWNPQTLSAEPYRLIHTFYFGGTGTVVTLGPALKILPRPEAEMRKLLELCDPRDARLRKLPPGFDPDRPGLCHFGFFSAPAQSSTPENLATLEEILSPGTLLDIVRLTRRAQAVYDAQQFTEKRKLLTDLLTWIETFPELQRQCMADFLAGWACQSKRLRPFGYEIALEVALRPHLVDGDLAARGRWLRSWTESPAMAPYVKQLEERLRTVQPTPEQRR